MRRGLFIVLEGIDGSGTTTQSECLKVRLEKIGISVYTTCEPSKGPVGRLLRRILSGDLAICDISEFRAPSWNTLALMFAADRLYHLESEVCPKLNKGITVICDRYYHSSLAYQSVTSDRPIEAGEWIRQINIQAKRPDLTIVLDVSPEAANQRRSVRMGREIFEQEILQTKLSKIYKNIETHFIDEDIVHIDGNASYDVVSEEVTKHALALLR